MFDDSYKKYMCNIPVELNLVQGNMIQMIRTDGATSIFYKKTEQLFQVDLLDPQCKLIFLGHEIVTNLLYLKGIGPLGAKSLSSKWLTEDNQIIYLHWGAEGGVEKYFAVVL